MSGRRTHVAQLFSVIFFVGALSAARFAYAQTPRPADQPADLSTIENSTEAEPQHTVEQDEPENSTEDLIASPKKHDHEPTPQIKKKADDYDPRYQQGVRYIEHPMAAKGLYLIDKNKVYYYRVKPTESTQESSLHMGPYDPTFLRNPSYPSITFDSIYSISVPMILYDWEKDIFKKFGRFGYKLGFGLFTAQGHGEFVEAPEQQAVAAGRAGPPENFTFLMFPLSAGGIYHLEYFKNQWFAPYGEAGLDAFCFAEMRDDAVNKFGAALGAATGAHFSVGVTIPLGHDYRSFLDIDREYGINKVSFVAEFRDYVAFESKWNFSGTVISGGFSVNY